MTVLASPRRPLPPRGFAPVLMVQGTGSGVGKSLLAAALCRLAARRGIRVAPFKAQNMSNNAAVTASGGEIGRAQALQARAAGVEPDERMNPVLLKPLADTRSEVVVLGRGRPEIGALPWRGRKAVLWPVVREALSDLRRSFDLVVAEGAGSPAEINLRDGDIVNMAVARHAGAAVILVADIDRGGAFAALYGTWCLLEPVERRHVRGFVLNRFRGDPSLLPPGPQELERRTGIPTLGVVPFIPHFLPEEDGAPPMPPDKGPVRVAVVRFPHASNLDDLDPLRAEPGVRVDPVARVEELGEPSAVILPGTRNTPGDLRWLRSVGLADAVVALGRCGTPVVGLCGGYQMLGALVADPHGIEDAGVHPGVCLLSVRTELVPAKETCRSAASIVDGPHLFSHLTGKRITGYEIHHGRTTPLDAPDSPEHSSKARRTVPWLESDGRVLGHADGPVWGCYLHGVFADDGFRRAWLGSLGFEAERFQWSERLERDLDRVGDAVAAALDVDALLRLACEAVP